MVEWLVSATEVGQVLCAWGAGRPPLRRDSLGSVLPIEEGHVPEKAVCFLAIPGFADWEAAHALAELRRHGRYRVRVVGLTREPVESMGGMTVQPDCGLADLDLDTVAVFIVPGGDRWEQQPVEPALLNALAALGDRGVPIAAICAGTTAVARAGLIRGRRHTSNSLAYLKQQVPEYSELVS
jgi:putative intracellular protease/amidase